VAAGPADPRARLMDFYQISPGTQLSFSSPSRPRPCWRCRTYRRLLRRRHWGCSPSPGMTYLGEQPETRDEELERRLRACETNLANIWEHLNARGTSDR
jgi:hypothetical protein